MRLLRLLATGWLACGIVVFLGQVCTACLAQEQTPTARVFDDREQTFVTGLMQRRLYDVAESHCLELLDRKETRVVDQTALTVQLVQIRTSMALTADASAAEDAWRVVWQTGEDFDKRFARHPGRIQVEIQTGLAHLQHAQRMGSALEAQMVPRADIASVTEAMLEQCRDAKRIFTRIEREIERLLPERRSKTITDGELGAQQLLALRSSVRYQIALSQLQVAAAYQDSDPVAWRSALTDVLKRLQEVQDSVVPSQQIWWLSKVSQLECLLMLGKTGEVERLLSTLPEQAPPSSILPRLIEQQLMLAIATDDKAKLKAHLSADSGSSPQLALVQVQAAVELSKLLDDPRQQAVWLEDASRRKQQVQLRHGAWWGRRAGLTLIRAAGGADVASAAGLSGGSAGRAGTATRTAAVELLVQTALQAQRDGDLNDALKAYDQAIAQTTAPGGVLQLQIRASQILEQQSQPLEAAKRLTTAASAAPNQPVAAATHLRGVWNLARASANSSAGKRSLVEALDGHLAQWPESPTKNTAAQWLMAEHIRLNDVDKALVAFDAVDSLSDSFPEALSQVRAMYFQVRKQAGVKNRKSVKLAGEIIARLRARQESLRETGDRGYRASMINTAIEIGLDSKAMSIGQLAKWSIDVRAGFAGEPASLNNEEKQLWAWFGLSFILKSKSPTQSDLDKAILALTTSNLDEAMCRRLFRVVSKRESELAGTDAGNGQSLSQRGALQLFGLEIIRIVNRLPLSTKESDRWKFQQGSLLRKSGKLKEAISLLEPLAQRFRSDLLIQQEFARALSEVADEARQEDALKVWRRLAKSVTPATENWYEARLNVARQLELSGDREAAKKLLLYTRSVYGWDKSTWADDLERLLRSLRSVSTP